MTAAATASPSSKYDAFVPLEEIAPSPTNPRQHFDEKKLKELAESIEVAGLIVPVLVRPVKEGKGSYELVDGERRWRAARRVGMEAIPAVIRDMTDVQVLEAQLVAATGEDLHPLEEADGYKRLLEMDGYTVDLIADKVGKSKAYVYARLKLCDLGENPRKAFLSGKLNPSTALLVARIPVLELQEKAVAAITDPQPWQEDNDGGMSVRAAAGLIQDKFMTSLKQAPFPIGDATLTAAGACGPCPKRSGNQGELFADIGDADMCTDPTCFAEKKATHRKALMAVAKEKGLEVVKEKNIFASHGKAGEIGVQAAGKYARPGDVVPGDAKKRTWRKLLGKELPVAFAIDGRGKGHEIVPIEEAAAAAKKAGHTVKLPKPGESRAALNPEKRAKAEAENALREKAAEQAIALAVAAVAKEGLSRRVLQLMVSRAATSDMICKIVGSEKPWPGDAERRKFDAKVDTMKGQELQALLFEGVIDIGSCWNGYPAELKEICRLFKIDLAKLEKAEREKVATTPKPAEETPKAIKAGKK